RRLGVPGYEEWPCPPVDAAGYEVLQGRRSQQEIIVTDREGQRKLRTGRGWLVRFRKKSLALRGSLRRNSKTVPWKSLLPDFAIDVTFAPPQGPCRVGHSSVHLEFLNTVRVGVSGFRHFPLPCPVRR